MKKQNEIIRTKLFRKWLDGICDKQLIARINSRILSAEYGNFGDYRSVGEGIFEMRIHLGQGYRVYYGRRGEAMYLLIAGGNKNTQNRDIAQAKLMWKILKERNYDENQ